VANYIKERTKNAQFVVISLRNNMFELAARLVGVYKVNHMTKSVTIENRDFIVRPSAATQVRGQTIISILNSSDDGGLTRAVRECVSQAVKTEALKAEAARIKMSASPLLQ